jgi:cell division protein FtsL
MALGKARRLLPLNHILLVLMAVLILYLVVDFARQVGVSYQRREELKQIEQSIDNAQARMEDLQGQLAYATSPAAAEQWARRDGLTRPNEVLVVFVGPAASSAPVGEKKTQDSTRFNSVRDAWWDLFFGTR